MECCPIMESTGPVQIPCSTSSTVERPQQAFDVPIPHAAGEGAAKRTQRRVFLCWLIQALGRLIDGRAQAMAVCDGCMRWEAGCAATPHAMGGRSDGRPQMVDGTAREGLCWSSEIF